jgi:hypothetical protein
MSPRAGACSGATPGGVRRLIACAAAVAALATGAARADEESGHTYFCRVDQPMVARDDRRVEVHTVTYALKLQQFAPGLEIRYTCEPGPVVVQEHYDADTVGASEITNLNAANLMGITVRTEKRPRNTWSVLPDSLPPARAGGKPRPRYYLDELRVQLDVSGLVAHRSQVGNPNEAREELGRLDALVDATVDCVLENARRSQPPIRKVRLEVVGWDRYKARSNVFAVKEKPELKLFRY